MTNHQKKIDEIRKNAALSGDMIVPVVFAEGFNKLIEYIKLLESEVESLRQGAEAEILGLKKQLAEYNKMKEISEKLNNAMIKKAKKTGRKIFDGSTVKENLTVEKSVQCKYDELKCSDCGHIGKHEENEDCKQHLCERLNILVYCD